MTQSRIGKKTLAGLPPSSIALPMPATSTTMPTARRAGLTSGRHRMWAMMPSVATKPAAKTAPETARMWARWSGGNGAHSM